MSETVVTKTVIRYMDCDNTYTYLGPPYDDSYNPMDFSSQYSFEEAEDLSNRSRVEMMQIFEKFQDENVGFDCELVKITVSTKVEDEFIDDEVLKELRQRAALKKLTDSDVKALGLTNIAVYIKTKYHNA